MNKLKSVIASSLLLLVSQVALAQIVINSVLTDPTANQVVITGDGFPAGSTVTLGGENILIPAPVVTTTEITLDFSEDTATAVPEQGSYLLQVTEQGGTPFTFSVYFDSPLNPPVVAGACPCEESWAAFGSQRRKNGFASLTPFCTYESPDASQVAVRFDDPKFGNFWILTSEFNSGIGEDDCALEIDLPDVGLDSLSEHMACSVYLKDNYFGLPDPDIIDCDIDVHGFPPYDDLLP